MFVYFLTGTFWAQSQKQSTDPAIIAADWRSRIEEGQVFVCGRPQDPTKVLKSKSKVPSINRDLVPYIRMPWSK